MISAYISLQFIIHKQIEYHCFVNITVCLALGRVFSLLLLFILTQLFFISFFLVPALDMVLTFCLGICIHRSTERLFGGAGMSYESWECT